MNTFLETIIVKVTASLISAIAKELFLGNNGTNAYNISIQDTIDYFYQKSIELQKKYFDNMLEDENVINSIKYFYEGNDYVSIDILTKAFLKSDFYMLSESEKEKEAHNIITYFVSCLKDNILRDPKIASLYINSVLNINFTKNTEFVNELKNNLKIYHDILLNKINIIDQKQDILLAGQSEQTQLMNQIKISLENSTKIIATNDIEFKKKFEYANDYFNKGKYITARDIYIELLKFDNIETDDKWRLNRNIAMTYLLTNKLNEAVPYYKAAYDIFPNEDKGKTQKIFVDLITISPSFALDEFDKFFKNKILNNEQITLKMNLCIKTGKPESALELFSEDNLIDLEIKYAYSHLLFQLKRFVEAESNLREVISKSRKPEFLLDLALYITVPIIEQLQKVKYGKKILPLDIENRLVESKSYLEECIKMFAETESKIEYASAIFNRGVLKNLLGEFDAGMEDFEIARSLGLNGIEINLNFATMFIRQGKFDRAINELLQVYKIDPQLALPHLLDAYYFNSQFNEINNLLLQDNHIKYPDIELNESNIHSYLMFSLVLERELKYTEVDRIINKIDELYPDEYEFIIKKVIILWGRGFKDEAIQYLEKKIQNATIGKDILKMKLADLYYEIQIWDKCINIYAEYKDLDEIFTLKYLNCLYELRKFNDLLSYTNVLLIEKKANVNTIKEFQANSYFLSDNFSDARPLYKELAINTGKSKFYLNWALCEFRLMNNKEAELILTKAEKEFSNSHLELSYIGHTLFNIGLKEKGLKLVYKAAINNPDDSAINQTFLNLMLFMTEKADYITEEMKILFNELIENWDTKFPDSHFFEKIPIDEDLNEIKNRIEQSNVYKNNILSLYDNRKVPFSFIPKNINRDFIEVWKNFAFSNYVKIWAYNPITYLYQKENIESKSIMIEPISFFTLYYLKSINLLEKIFENYYFPQFLLDELHSYLQILSSKDKIENITLYNIDGKLTYQKISKEEIQEEIIIVTNMINIIKNKIGGSTYNIIDIRVKPLLNEATVQSMNYSLEKNISVLSDDALLNEMFERENSLKYFSTYTLFLISLEKGLISKEQFNKNIIDLINFNYHFIPITSEAIAQEIDDRPIKENFRITKVINTFKELNRDKEKDYIVITELIIQIYDKKISDMLKTQWIDLILDSLTANNFDYENAISSINEKINQYFTFYMKNGSISELSADKFKRWFEKICTTWKILRSKS